MLIYFKTSIKTSILLLMFILGNNSIMAARAEILHQFNASGNSDQRRFDKLSVINPDTILTQASKTETNSANGINVPDSLAGKMIDFQVNSEISYLTFKHFVKNESKEMFYQALVKEGELKHVSSQTDSLRKVYSASGNDKKEEIAVLILKNEEHSGALNQEISTLYQSAREMEDQYWQNCPASERIKFQEKIKSFKDSITRSKMKEEAEKASKIMIDTLFVSHASMQNKETKTESVTAIVYKIQIGAFKGKIPDSSNNMIKKLSVLRKVENYTDEKGVKIYTTGNLKTHQEALILQTQVKQEGVKNPLIVAFQNGKKIAVEEARKINKEL